MYPYKSIDDEGLRSLLEAVGDDAWEWNVATGAFDGSANLCTRMGYSEEERPKTLRDVMDFVHLDDRAPLAEAIRRVESGEASRIDCEIRFRAKDGSWWWLRERGGAVEYDETGRIITCLGTTTDITAQKRAEIEAHEAHERLRLAQENAGAGTWDMDLETDEVRLCPLSLHMHGLPEDTPMPLREADWEAALDPADAPAASAAFHRAIETAAHYYAEYRTRQGRTVLGLGRAIVAEDGRPVRFVGLNLDVTDRRRSEATIAQMQAELVHLTRLTAMGTMASTMAHELNQPLAAIALYSAAARRLAGDDAGETLQAALARIEDNSLRAGSVIRRLRQSLTRGPENRENASLQTLVSNALELALLDRRSDEMETKVQVRPGLLVEVDPIQIEQVLVNLIRNAAEAMADAPEKKLSVLARKRGRSVVVSVSDTGCGLPEEMRERLFQPFFTTKESGMGIGLSISRTIVEAHGGRLWVEASRDGGSTFCFTVPPAPAV